MKREAVGVVRVGFVPAKLLPIGERDLDNRARAMRHEDGLVVRRRAVDTLVEADVRALAQGLLKAAVSEQVRRVEPRRRERIGREVEAEEAADAKAEGAEEEEEEAEEEVEAEEAEEARRRRRRRRAAVHSAWRRARTPPRRAWRCPRAAALRPARGCGRSALLSMAMPSPT